MSSALLRRGVAVVALLGVLFGLCLWFGTLAPDHTVGAYPDSTDVGVAPAEYVGTPVDVGGTVVSTAPVVVELDYGTGSRRVTVTGVSHPVSQGDTLRVFGTLTEPGVIRATNSFAVPPAGATYTYTVSFLAGLWVLGRLALGWRLDDDRGLVRRRTPLRPIRRLRRRLRSGRREVTDRDA
jgi:hypothetical protein